jgi:transposase
MANLRRQFSKEFKEEAVKLVIEKGYRVSEAARSLDIHPNLLSRWKRLVEDENRQAFSTNGNSSDLKKEIRRLKRENELLRMEKEILKKAAAFFAKESNKDLSSSSG